MYRINFRNATLNNADLLRLPLLAPCVQELNTKIQSHPEFWNVLGQLVNITDLNIEENNLTELPESIANLTNLEVLDVENNAFSEVPPILEQMSQISNLKLEGNSISELPAWLFDFPNLKLLDLSLCPITNLPDDIAKLADTLEAIGLYGCPIPANQRQRIRNLLPNTDVRF